MKFCTRCCRNYPDARHHSCIYDEYDALKAENAKLRAALEAIAAKGPASPGDKKHEIAALALRGAIQNKLNSGDSGIET